MPKNRRIEIWIWQLKVVKYVRGGKHVFLGMELDFDTDPGKCNVKQRDHIEDLVSAFPEELRGNSPTPVAADLLQKGARGLLCREKWEVFHSVVAKGF